MTDQEYMELKERLTKDGLILAADRKQLSKQHSYFMEASQYACKRFNDAKIGAHAGWGPLYENAKKIIMWTYGAKRVVDMPDEAKEEANHFIIRICDEAIRLIEEQV